jgi:hypothetical protein
MKPQRKEIPQTCPPKPSEGGGAENELFTISILIKSKMTLYNHPQLR